MKKIEEDVAPVNCVTPGDVGGMGDIYFPSDDGEPGSGDIPLPSGKSKVYKQVKTFDTFVKTKKKKGEQKKFTTPDESPDSPYYKKLESSEYYKDFVYDFKTYIKKSKEDI